MMSKQKNIIAVVGMCGSGKSEVVNYLQRQYAWPKVYLGEVTFERMKQENLNMNYENERIIREKIRSELGMGGYATLTLPKINKLLEKNDNIIIESLYSWDEYKIFEKEYGENFKVIAVHASPDIRLKRMLAREKERPIKNKEEFKKRDFSEIEGTDKGGPIARANFMIVNEGMLDEMHEKINNIINNIKFS